MYVEFQYKIHIFGRPEAAYHGVPGDGVLEALSRNRFAHEQATQADRAVAVTGAGHYPFARENALPLHPCVFRTEELAVRLLALCYMRWPWALREPRASLRCALRWP